MLINLYAIQSKNWHENRDRAKSLPNCSNCVICGKNVNLLKKHFMVHLCKGGSHLKKHGPCDTPDACLGGWPVGPDCYRKHKDLLKDFVTEGVAQPQG